jgi:hypothetical protein
MLMSESVLVRVHGLDPISESGILAQLRQCPDIRVTDTVPVGGAGAGGGLRRQGLEPRTRGLRVSCFVRLFSLNCCQIMLGRAVSCHSVRLPACAPRCGYRVVPDRTGASEQTWSKHRCVLV